MNRSWITVAALPLLVLGACSSPSLSTLSGPGTRTQDPGLVGEWTTEGPTVTRVVITDGPDDKYTGALTIHSGTELKTGLTLEVSLTQIGADTYADLYLAKPDREHLAGRYGFLVLPVHQFMMISRDGDNLSAWTFDAAWVREAAADYNFSCDVLPVGGREIAVITAHTDSLRHFLLKHAHDQGALSPPLLFHRLNHAAPASTTPAN